MPTTYTLLDKLKRFAAPNDGELDEVLLSLCLDAAQEQIAASGVRLNIWRDSATYQLVAMQLATYYYDNRGADNEGRWPKLPPHLQAAVNAMRYKD